MDFSKIPLFQALGHKMDWLGQRQQVLARNIANVNTPGFKPRDIEAPDFSALLARSGGNGSPAPQPPAAAIALAATHPRHITSEPGDEKTRAAEVKIDTSDAPKRISGNAVVLEKELMKVGKTAMDYQLSTSIYKRYVSMFKTAIGRGGG